MNDPATSKGSRQRIRDAGKAESAIVAPTPPPAVRRPGAPAGDSRPTAPIGKAAAGQTGVIPAVSAGQASAPPPQTPPPARSDAAKAGQAAKRPIGKGKVTQTARQAHLRVTKLDLLAVLKMSFLFAFCVSLVSFVALFALWHILTSTGVIDNAQGLLNSVLGNPTTGGTATVQLAQYLNNSRVVGFIAGVSVINVFLLTLIGTIFGALYNLASVLFGGLEVTLEV